MPKLRFAQAGGSALHANMYRETLDLLADEIELVGFYDPDPEAVRPNLGPGHAELSFYDSVAALIAGTHPDAVLVSAHSRDMPALMTQGRGGGGPSLGRETGRRPFAPTGPGGQGTGPQQSALLLRLFVAFPPDHPTDQGDDTMPGCSASRIRSSFVSSPPASNSAIRRTGCPGYRAHP